MKPRRIYYTRGPKDCPLESGKVKLAPIRNDFNIIHWHTQFQLNYVESGSIEVFSLNGNTSVHEGEIYIVPPEEVHGIRVTTQATTWTDLVFSPELVTVPEGHFFHNAFIKPLREGTLRFPRLLSPGDPHYSQVLEPMLKILNTSKNSPDYKSQVFLQAIALCLALLPMCSIADPSDPNPLTGVRGNDAVKICTSFIGRNYYRQITLQELADLVHLHPNYLCRLFKEYSGQTIFEYLTSIRVSYASQFIRRYDKPLRQIAEECGFNSMSYFNKKFKEHHGLTPYAYSKLYKNR